MTHNSADDFKTAIASEPLSWIVGYEDLLVVTGAAGFVGCKVVAALLERGFRNLRCLLRPSADVSKFEATLEPFGGAAAVEVFKGNLLSRDDCVRLTRNARVIYHLAAGRGEKSFPDAFLNSVVTTRNLLEAAAKSGELRRFVTVSSFSVYKNVGNPGGRLLDETSPIEDRPQDRGDAYTYAKSKQDELVIATCKAFNIPYVIVRPGVIYGPGNEQIHGRVGLGTFGLFLHLGGSNRLPLTYVDNCAEAISLAGLAPGIDGEVFNLIDDDLPTSRSFLHLYKKRVRSFKSIYLPHAISYFLCWAWERYSRWSHGQLPPVFNRKMWHTYWKRTDYTNAKAKERLGWQQKVATLEALERYFASCRRKLQLDAASG